MVPTGATEAGLELVVADGRHGVRHHGADGRVPRLLPRPQVRARDLHSLRHLRQLLRRPHQRDAGERAGRHT